MNIVSYNGIVLEDRFCISVYNGSFLYGVNCFEGLRGYWDISKTRLHLLDIDEHLNRLFDSASRLRLNHSFSKEFFKKELMGLVKDRNVKENVYVRITLFIDGETSWIEKENISYLISIRSMGSSLSNDFHPRSYSLYLTGFRRNSENSTPPSIKAGGNYLNSRYAKLEAIENGFDDALILNQEGFISESSGSCIFFIKDGKLLTPSLNCDILPSITRRRIIALCLINGIAVEECRLKPDQLREMDGAFLCGSMIEIMPVSLIDNNFMKTNELALFNRLVDLFKDSISEENI